MLVRWLGPERNFACGHVCTVVWPVATVVVCLLVVGVGLRYGWLVAVVVAVVPVAAVAVRDVRGC